jgi:exopolysaccharide biosynthesis polyprenyl glycosylphosphotransferase
VDSWQYIYLKRLFDIAFSAAMLILTFPVFAIITLLVKLSSRGPVFFKQTRLGGSGREFVFYKFRTMYNGPTRTSDVTWTTRNDKRITRVGKFLRKTSLDELPQFWNVFKGDMSVVGPRPERPHFVKQFQKQIPQYMVRHQVKTGITGWAQVNGLRGDTSIPERIKYDLFYIENWSFSFDLKIILLTLWRGMVSRNAY